MLPITHAGFCFLEWQAIPNGAACDLLGAGEKLEHPIPTLLFLLWDT